MRGEDGKIHCLDRLTVEVLDKFGVIFGIFLEYLTYIAILLVQMGTLAHMFNSMAPVIPDAPEIPPLDLPDNLPPIARIAQAPQADPLSWDFQTFAVITDLGYCAITEVLLLSHMEIDKFLSRAPLLGHWFARCALQIFIGVQTVQMATTLKVSGNQRTGVVELGEAAGWLMGGVGFFNFFFNTLYKFENRPCRICGFCCILSFAVLIPIFAMVGTTE